MEMEGQAVLFPEFIINAEKPKPVNVASIPQRSPFRYPGGKTWFVPTFRRWLTTIYRKPNILVEPFAGGGIISLTALFEGMVDKAIMVELDEDIAAVWESVVNGNAEWLAQRILSFELTREAVLEEIGKIPRTKKEKAFQTILKNRTLHGGILAEGSGFLKHGENGKGISSRWYPATIAKRFLNIKEIAYKIDFLKDDGLTILEEHKENVDAIYFIDPPYTAGGKKAGKRLYRHHEVDHQRLFDICRSLKGDFLMTYDNAVEVREMARNAGFQMRLIPMNNTHHATMEELIVGKDLSWMDDLVAVHEPEVEYTVNK
jgi:DNA adenine methylase